LPAIRRRLEPQGYQFHGDVTGAAPPAPRTAPSTPSGPASTTAAPPWPTTSSTAPSAVLPMLPPSASTPLAGPPCERCRKLPALLEEWSWLLEEKYDRRSHPLVDDVLELLRGLLRRLTDS
jgi:hypothetical protein